MEPTDASSHPPAPPPETRTSEPPASPSAGEAAGSAAEPGREAGPPPRGTRIAGARLIRRPQPAPWRAPAAPRTEPVVELSGPPTQPTPLVGSPPSNAGARPSREEAPPTPAAFPIPTIEVPSPLGRLLAIIITAGLAWALVAAIGIWILALLFSRH